MSDIDDEIRLALRNVKQRVPDGEYFDHWTEHFQCDVQRDIVARGIAGHSDLTRFTMDQLSQFRFQYRKIISLHRCIEEAINANYN
ncbi:MAG: hypothetical protein AAF468_12415 [Pseudomonadota bacterium]